MRYLLQPPVPYAPSQQYPLWIVLHGAFAHAEQALEMFGQEARDRQAFLLAPQATRPCGAGFCWSFAHDAAAIRGLLDMVSTQYSLDARHVSLIGYSMGCTMGCWLLAQSPGTFSFFGALGMGSAFEPWEHDDGGIPEDELRRSAAFTRIFLAVDRNDPAGCAAYFEDNRARFVRAGFQIETFRPDQGTHAVTDGMKAALLRAFPR